MPALDSIARPRLLLTVLLLLTVGHTMPASAWGPEGHRMVAEIASRSLNPAAQARILELLRDDRYADGEPSGRDTLAGIANWADEIKDYDWGRRRGGWHYDDISLCGPALHENYCRNGNCASAQIARHVDVLRNPGAGRGRRNEALKWIVHLVGDIHQPLHAATRHDRGGNTVQVSFFGERDNPPYGAINLHAIWDVHLVRRLIAQRKGEAGIVTTPVDAVNRTAWEQGSIAEWVEESHALARDFVYAELPAPASCAERIRKVVTVDDNYYNKAAPVIVMQIRKAGVRLARLLNEALGR